MGVFLAPYFVFLMKIFLENQVPPPAMMPLCNNCSDTTDVKLITLLNCWLKLVTASLLYFYVAVKFNNKAAVMLRWLAN